MVAIVLLVVFVGAVLSLVIQQGHHRQSNLQTTLATNAALTNLERVRTVDIGEVLKLNGSGFEVRGLNGEANGLLPVAGDPDGLPGEFHVSLAMGSGTLAVYRVAAVVRWRHGQRTREVRLESLIGDRK